MSLGRTGAAARLDEELSGTPSIELAGVPHPVITLVPSWGEERYTAAVARGRSRPTDEIVQLALADAPESPAQPAARHLRVRFGLETQASEA